MRFTRSLQAVVPSTSGVAVVGVAVLLTACAGTPVVAPAGMVPAALPRVGVAHVDRRIARAYYAVDIPALESLRLALRRRVDSDPQAGKYAWYNLGFANFALADDSSSTDRFDSHINVAQRALKKAVALDPHFADVYALLSLTYAVEISRHHWKAMVLGIKAGHAIGKAVALAPNNPRVVLLQGFSDMGTPAVFGGSDRRGRSEYARALRLFERGPQRQTGTLTWGRGLALRWLADAERLHGDFPQARRHYEAALKLFPDYAGARSGLSRLAEKKRKVAD